MSSGVADEVEEVLDLLIGADGVLRHVRIDVGGAHQYAVAHGVDEDDPAIGVLEEDLASAAGVEEAGVVKHDVRALGAAHEGRCRAHGLVGEVHPRSGGVDDDVSCEVELFPGEFVAQPDGAATAGSGVGCR